MRNLANLHLTRRALLVLAVLSVLASVLVLHVGHQRSAAQTAALAALRTAPDALSELKTLSAARAAAATTTAPVTVTVVEAPAPTPAASSTSESSGSGDSTASSSTSSSDTTTTASTATRPTRTRTTSTTTTTTPTDTGLPKVGHVFVIELSDTGYTQAFGSTSPATYLQSLLSQGTLLSNYRSLGHGELADELASTIGQPPNTDTTGGCRTYTPFPATASPDSAGVLTGRGCIYPDSVASLADNLTEAGKRWAAYLPGLDDSACAVPEAGGSINAPIQGVSADYDPVHNPFIFFQSLLEDGGCAASDLDLSKLADALRTTSTTPAYTYIAPDACADGSHAPVGGTSTATGTTTTGTGTVGVGTASATATSTATTTGTTTTPTAATRTGICAGEARAGIPAEDAFLSQVVPEILASGAYKQNGVLIIAFNGESPTSGHSPFSTGALVLSHWTRANRVISTHYSPYSLLHSVEDMLDLQPLAEAAGAPAFARAVL